ALVVGVAAFWLLIFAEASRAQRLPGEALPQRYALQLTPDLVSGRLEGQETIEVELPRSTSVITLHSIGFDLLAWARVVGMPTGDARGAPATIALDSARETAELRFVAPLPAGKVTLALEFTGRVRDDLRGLYRIQSNGRWYAATQFEGTYARMMFPCFDEPEYKATFDLSVTVDAAATAISNGALLGDVAGPRPGQHTLKFVTSPKMSTYLVALAIGDLQCVTGESDGVPLRVCALPEKKELGRFALQVAERFLHFYNGYYGIRYPFGKLDMVAFPDYEWGGMENAGAVFYKERALLVDALTASAQARRRVASVVAHEMAHQWFGDLVTMKWWDNVWLNEGFATWMAHKPLQDWDAAWDQDVEATRSAQQVLGADALSTTRPIRQNAATSAEIKELFDGVAYDKGAAMLRMVEAYVGEDVFQKGVNEYISRHANGSATAEDFWSDLARISGRPVERILSTFVDQPGAPLVSVETRCAGDQTEVTLTQQRFFVDPARLAAASPELWSIPICMRGSGQAARCELLNERRQTFALPGCAPFVFINAGAHGYYRSGYPPEALSRIAGAAGQLTAAEQVALLEDSWALVRVGRVGVGDYLALAEGLKSSRNLTVAGVLIGRLQSFDAFLDEDDVPAYRGWLRSVLEPAIAELTFSVHPGESDDRATLRSVVFAALGEADDPPAILAASRLAADALSNSSAVDASLLNAALPIAAAHGDAALYDRFLAAMQSAKTPEQAFRWLTALASFKQEALVRRSLDLMLSPQMRAQDLPAFSSLLLTEDASRPLTWAFLKAHWDELQSKVVSFGGGGAVSALGSFCDTAAANDVEAFFATHRAPAAERMAQQSLERIRACAELAARVKEPLHRWVTDPPGAAASH
ncbi:MAG: M1 family metallopeptidase, partial [Acidobacteriota bacterium]